MTPQCPDEQCTFESRDVIVIKPKHSCIHPHHRVDTQLRYPPE